MEVFVLILLLYGCELAQSFHRAIYEYHIIHLEKTWFEAQQHCRQHYTDLATFRDMDDINSFQRPGSFTEDAWIGLFDDPASWKTVMSNDSNSWRWSVTGTTSPGGYQNWSPNEPDHYKSKNHCGIFFGNGLWGDATCSNRYHFVCFSESADGPKQYSYISTSLSWEEAQIFCREHYTDLAMIEDESENSAVLSALKPNQWTWFGLYRQPFRWSDGSSGQFTNWMPGQPNNDRGAQHCVWESNNHLWNDMTCSLLRKFICQRALKTQIKAYSVKLLSDVDLSDPSHSQQIIQKLVALLQSQGLTDFRVTWKAPPQKMQKKDRFWISNVGKC